MEAGQTGKDTQGGGALRGRKLGKMWAAAVGAAVGVAVGMVCAPAFVFAEDRSLLERCPREHLRAVYLQAVEHKEIVDLAAVEVEVLKLCRARQSLISEIIKGERELAALREERSGAGQEPGAAAKGLPSLLSLAERTDEPRAERERPAGAGAAQTTPTPPARDSYAPAVVADPAPAYRWFTAYGSGADLVAGITDGAERWWVRAGDRLPGGVEVVAVGVRPVTVRVAARGRQWQLPGPAAAGTGGGSP